MPDDDSYNLPFSYNKGGSYFNSTKLESRTMRTRGTLETGALEGPEAAGSSASPNSRRAAVREVQFLDGSDFLANSYKQVLSFYHVPSGQSTFFKAFLTAYNETYSPEWNEESVYGRADPIYLFKQTTRNITMGYKIPAATVGEAAENLERVQRLVQYLYPAYEDASSATTISQSPLVRLGFQNMVSSYTSATVNSGRNFGIPHVSNNPNTGLLGVVKNLTINYNMEGDAGVFQVGGSSGLILPKLIEINFDFGVVHEHSLGWHKIGSTYTFSSEKFPYGMSTGASAETATDAMSRTQRQAGLSNRSVGAQAGTVITQAQLEQERRGVTGQSPSEAAAANRESRYMGMLGSIRRRIDENAASPTTPESPAPASEASPASEETPSGIGQTVRDYFRGVAAGLENIDYNTGDGF